MWSYKDSFFKYDSIDSLKRACSYIIDLVILLMSPILTTSKLENKSAMNVGPINFVTVIFMPSLFFISLFC